MLSVLQVPLYGCTNMSCLLNSNPEVCGLSFLLQVSSLTSGSRCLAPVQTGCSWFSSYSWLPLVSPCINGPRPKPPFGQLLWSDTAATETGRLTAQSSYTNSAPAFSWARGFTLLVLYAEFEWRHVVTILAFAIAQTARQSAGTCLYDWVFAKCDTGSRLVRWLLCVWLCLKPPAAKGTSAAWPTATPRRSVAALMLGTRSSVVPRRCRVCSRGWRRLTASAPLAMKDHEPAQSLFLLRPQVGAKVISYSVVPQSLPSGSLTPGAVFNTTAAISLTPITLSVGQPQPSGRITVSSSIFHRAVVSYQGTWVFNILPQPYAGHQTLCLSAGRSPLTQSIPSPLWRGALVQCIMSLFWKTGQHLFA